MDPQSFMFQLLKQSEFLVELFKKSKSTVFLFKNKFFKCLIASKNRNLRFNCLHDRNSGKFCFHRNMRFNSSKNHNSALNRKNEIAAPVNCSKYRNSDLICVEIESSHLISLTHRNSRFNRVNNRNSR